MGYPQQESLDISEANINHPKIGVHLTTNCKRRRLLSATWPLFHLDTTLTPYFRNQKKGSDFPFHGENSSWTKKYRCFCQEKETLDRQANTNRSIGMGELPFESHVRTRNNSRNFCVLRSGNSESSSSFFFGCHLNLRPSFEQLPVHPWWIFIGSIGFGSQRFSFQSQYTTINHHSWWLNMVQNHMHMFWTQGCQGCQVEFASDVGMYGIYPACLCVIKTYTYVLGYDRIGMYSFLHVRLSDLPRQSWFEGDGER